MRLTIMGLAACSAIAACGGDGSGPPQEASQLAFTAQPTASLAGEIITPAVEVSVQDASGSLVRSAATPITLSLTPGSGALGGTTTVNAAAGVATFPDLRITAPGAGYALAAAAAGLTGASSAAFVVSTTPAGVPVAIGPAGGNGQTATVGQAVATAPSVKVTDGFGDPVANVSVAFSVALGEGGTSGVDQTTNGAGVAAIGQWTLGTAVGANALLATAPGLAGSPVTFTAYGTAGPAATVSPHVGDGQSASIGTEVAQAPSVLVTDSYANPVAGVAVTFAVTSGGGGITDGSPTTGGDGVAAVGTWTLGDSPGPNTLAASVASVAGPPVTFTATATALPTAATVEVRNHFFRSTRNGSGSEFTPTPFGTAAVDTIAAGGTVTWQWVGQGHNVTPYENSAFTQSGTHGASFTFGPIAFNTPGTYRYRCTNHSSVLAQLGLVGMRGVIVVR